MKNSLKSTGLIGSFIKKERKLFFALVLILNTVAVFSQPKPVALPKTRILFIFDASQSMFGIWQSGRKIDVAKRLLSELLDSLGRVNNIELGLRVYGHQTQLLSHQERDCKDSKLEVPFAPKNSSKIKNRISTITPNGTTPIAYSLEQAAGDFPDCSNCRNLIILITDGIEECDGDPCAVSLALQKKGVVLKPFVIGMGLGVEVKNAFECIGTYYDAANEEVFRTVLNVVINQALNSTTAQVNLLDITGKPTETNVNMTFYDSFSGAVRYNYVHTLNHRGNPDTIVIDPLGTYKMVVHTIPPMVKDSIVFIPGKHNIVSVDAPQGNLLLKMRGLNEYKSLKIIVRKKGEMKTLNIQEFNKSPKYIVGKYDLEILTLPRIYVKDVVISQSHTTTVEISQPGIVSVLMSGTGYGSLYLEEDNKLKWIYNLKENQNMQSVTLQPGGYRIIYRAGNSKESIYTIERPFTIEPGGSVSVKLY